MYVQEKEEENDRADRGKLKPKLGTDTFESVEEFIYLRFKSQINRYIHLLISLFM